MNYVWLIIAIFFFIVEGISVQLISIWFAIGAIAAMITQLAGGTFFMQFALFTIVTGLCLIVTRPFIKKLKHNKVSTNVDRLIGEKALVLEDIDPMQNSGQVKVLGQIWTARSINNVLVPKGSFVKVEKIEGVKLIVS